jgi:predicted nucleic acid-binding protein
VIVYVESNFVLELVLQQEQEAYALRLFDLAATGSILLVLPAMALVEPHAEIESRARRRRELAPALVRESAVLNRSAARQEMVHLINALADQLAEIQRDETRRLDEVLNQLLSLGHCIPVDRETLRAARQFEVRLDLSAPDALMLASVLADAAQRPRSLPKVFASRDRKAFFHPDIRAALAEHNCVYVAHFHQAADYVRSQLG